MRIAPSLLLRTENYQNIFYQHHPLVLVQSVQQAYIFWGSQLDHVATLEIYGIVQRHFLLSWLRRGGNANIQWVETKDTAKHPTRYRIALSKSYLTQNINSVEPEKLCSTLKTQQFDCRGTS